MWKFFSGILLRNKLVFTICVLIGTVFMTYETSRMELSYEFAKILPDDDSTFISYQNFKKQFGEDGNVMVMGFKDKDLFKFEKFRDWHELSKEVKNIQGIKEVMSLPTIFKLSKNDSLGKFETIPLIQNPISSQKEVDSLKAEILNLPFYEGFIYNKETGATLLLITFKKKDLDSKRRLTIVDEIKTLGDAFSKKHAIDMHYSGMPYIRSQMMTKVSSEMTLFLTLAVCVTAIILWLFFRSATTVIFSLIVVIIGVVWSIGIMELFGYKITVLSGLIAPLIMVIGLPNCIFLINKYHSEFLAHGNKIKALQRSIETIGITLFLANITTAIGFGVLYFTKSSMLVEFGEVAAISVMATYFITLILIPIILNILPTPKTKHTKHQEGKRINKALEVVDSLVQKRRPAIYLTTTLITLVSFWGMTFIDMNGYVVDDLPIKDPIYADLHFFENNFKGVLPFEIAIDTRKPNGLFSDNAKALYKIQRLQKLFAEYDLFSKPFSIVEGIKFSYQAYRGGEPKFYKLPPVSDLKNLADFTGSLKGQNSKLQNFIDSTKQITRISYQAKDIGSRKMDVLMKELRPRIDSIFPAADYGIVTTGHSLVFLKSNDYLLDNLLESLLIEIILIAIVGIALFRSVRIIILSKLPCLIPLVITAGIMGFLDIRFKPSTILIFSIAFGISSDGTIYFLTKYRQELKKNKKNAAEAISAAIKDTGLSMVYTSIILFCGFAIFAASSFGGTVALGVLVSLTLLISMFTNLILLPAILLSIHRKSLNKEITDDPYIDIEESIEERGKDLSGI
ncbi:efflux RND transporter permease subunit [Aurantibacillus circumpalustris]|uniref:efflux RND transporter permease subunit n=1 Tax=Aurantibacillus circumpalustris TaxID=3036359 RepID=UPI00295A8056|nr:MMPL family transporter [Aurantibacillus circumpalustris]